ncbi:MAG: AMP-binding protein [Pseudomonadota bacterium]
MTAPFCIGKRPDETRSRAGFAADVAALRPKIAGPSRVCNLLEDRYRFMVGLAAAVLNGQRMILPSAKAPGAIRLALGEPEDVCLLGSPGVPGLAERVLNSVPDGSEAGAEDISDALAESSGRIEVYTSGSTGAPVCHPKDWVSLAGGSALAEMLYGLAGLPDGSAILGTTPHQHMFGLEAAILAGLAHGRPLYRGTVFYPEDLSLAARTCTEQGMAGLALVTSPAHLRYLEPVIHETPSVRMILSATAPMPLALAERLEARGGLPVFEIYGSTETGSLAWRRTVERPEWRQMDGFRLDQTLEGTIASAPHLPEPVLLGDLVEVAADGRFLLLGRLGDMIHVAGKRTSLGALNAILVEAPGLADGVVLRARTGGDDRLRILAVRDRASNLSDDEIRAALRRHMQAHVDPVFIPRRIDFVSSLPRSATGKITDQAAAHLSAELR